MKSSISVGDAREIIRERIAMGIWLSVIFATKGDIGSMNTTLRKGVEVNSRVGNTGSRIQTTPEGKSICSTEMVIMVIKDTLCTYATSARKGR